MVQNRAHDTQGLWQMDSKEALVNGSGKWTLARERGGWGGTVVMLLLHTVYSAHLMQRDHGPPAWASGTVLTAKPHMMQRWTSGS